MEVDGGDCIAMCGECSVTKKKGEAIVLYTIAVILILLWLAGLLSSYTMGGLIHALLVIAIVVVLFRVISGRKPL